MRPASLSFPVISFPLLALLAGCGGPSASEEQKLRNEMASAIANDAAVNSALRDMINVDPDLTGAANSDAVRPPDGARGAAVPSAVTGAAAKALAAQAEADAKTAAGGNILRAPAPRAISGEEAKPFTLGAMAEASGKGGEGCGRQITYGAAWANKMPAPFAIYPRANLAEAAGVTNGKCNLIAISFATPVPAEKVVDYYYTRARAAGFSAEHLLAEKEHRLGGTKGNGPAFIVFARPLPDGRTEVDIVANEK
jgi:hypothetical protein